jgi:hypothetical protein
MFAIVKELLASSFLWLIIVKVAQPNTLYGMIVATLPNSAGVYSTATSGNLGSYLLIIRSIFIRKSSGAHSKCTQPVDGSVASA